MWNSSFRNDDDLRHACLHNDVETVRKLCKLQNVNLEIEDSDCTTPLMLGCYYGNYDVVYELISNQNTLVDHGNNMDVNPLHYACEQQHIEIVKLLLDNNANINAQTKKGYTALHYSSITNNFELCKLLLLRGANKTIRDNYGQTAIDIANKRKCDEILIHLLNRKNNEEIRKLQNNTTKTSHQIKLNHRINSNHAIELEKERIMRGEISTLKDNINEMQYENDINVDKLMKRIGFVEDYVQGLSVSVHSMLEISPKYNSLPMSPATLNNPNSTTLSSNIIPRISVPNQNKNKQIIITKTEHTPLDTPMTELNTPISPQSAHSPVTYDRDNENVTIGLNTDYEYDLEDDECKNYRPDIKEIPSLRPEANSLELGGFSDYDCTSISHTVYSTKTTTPRLQSSLSNIIDEPNTNDPMSPIHEDVNTPSTNAIDYNIMSSSSPALKNKYKSSPAVNMQNHNRDSKTAHSNSSFAETFEYNRYNNNMKSSEVNNENHDHHRAKTTQVDRKNYEQFNFNDINNAEIAPHINDDDNQKYPDLVERNMSPPPPPQHDHEEVEISEEEYAKLMGLEDNNSKQANEPVAMRHSSDPMIHIHNKTVDKRKDFSSPHDSPLYTGFVPIKGNTDLDIPNTIGMLGTVSPDTVDAVSRSAKLHEQMTNAQTFQTSFYNPNIITKKKRKTRQNRTQSVGAHDIVSMDRVAANYNSMRFITKPTPFNKQNVSIKTPPANASMYNSGPFDVSYANKNTKRSTKRLYNDVLNPINDSKQQTMNQINVDRLRNRKNHNKKQGKTETVSSFRSKKMKKRKKKTFTPNSKSNVYTDNY